MNEATTPLGAADPAPAALAALSPWRRDLLTLVEKTYEAKHPELDVRWLDMGSQDVYDRIRAEKANPGADVWFGGPNLVFASGARETADSATSWFARCTATPLNPSAMLEQDGQPAV